MIDLTSISRFAAHVLAVRPVLGKELHEPAAFTRAEMAAALEGAKADDEAAFKRRLRRLGGREVLRVMGRELNADAPLEEVRGTMSDLAELSIATALDWVGTP